MKSVRLLLTAGDPAGIGPEVCLKAVAHLLISKSLQGEWSELAHDFKKGDLSLSVVGHPLALMTEGRRRIPSLKWNLEGVQGPGGFVPFFSSVASPRVVPVGKITKEAGRQALASLDWAVRAMSEGTFDGVVTAPVNKESIHRSQSDFIGHTEYFARAFGVPSVSMAFLSPIFTLVLVTTHVGLRTLPDLITPEALKRSISDALRVRRMLHEKTPVVVLGLNPHAGEGGMFGSEDAVIRKVVRSFRKSGHSVEGPVAADSAFVDVLRGRWKTVVACYHDQGLIPLKMLSKGRSVNVTLGLPVVRTSVDHGTAFDIAGKWVAEEGSMLAAIQSARDLVRSSLR